MPILRCEKCGDPYRNHNPKTKLCPECNPNSALNKLRGQAAMNRAFRDREQHFDGNKRRTHTHE